MGRLEEVDGRWHQEAEAILAGMKEWRLQHPRATFREIEAALDERLDGLRARLLEDLALASAAAEIDAAADRPVCPACGVPLEPRGRRGRTVVTRGERPVHLERTYGVCPACGAGLFPPG